MNQLVIGLCFSLALPLVASAKESDDQAKIEDDGLGRQDSAAGQKGERDGIAGVKTFSAHVSDLKVDVFGATAVATLILSYDVDTGKEKMAGKDRSTLVFVKQGGTWKIVHEHHSPLKNPT